MDRGFVNDWRRRSQTSPFNHDELKEELFLQYCDLVEDGSIEPTATDSMDVVDNWYVNGDFVRRDGETDEEWMRICEDCHIHNDRIAKR